MEEIRFLFFTVAVESFVSVLLLRQEGLGRVLLSTFAVNIISHPIAWHFAITENVNWLLIETFVALFEMTVFALVFPNIRKRAVVAALLMNILSAVIGILFF